MVYLFLILVILANAFANIFIKLGVNRLPNLAGKGLWFGISKIVTSPLVLLGAFLLVASFPLFSYVLQKINLSIAYPALVVGAIIIVAIFSALFLKESISYIQVIGIFLIMGGIWLLFRK